MIRRRFLCSAAGTLLLPAALSAQQNDPVLRTALERAWQNWRFSMSSRDAAKWALATSRYRHMCLRNEIVSLRMPWPGALFNLVFTAPPTERLQLIDASAVGDTARLVYFGQVDMGLDYGPVKPENPLVIHFLREHGEWRFNTLQYVNLNLDEDLKREVRGGGRKWLENAEFQLSGQYPPIPKPCPAPYLVTMARMSARNCTVKVSVNGGQWEDTVDNTDATRVVIGGLKKGGNPVKVVVTPGRGGAPLAAVSFSGKQGQRLTPLQQWKLPEGDLQPEYSFAVWVKSSVSIQ